MDGDYYGDEDLYESEEEELELEGSESAAQPGAGDPEDDNDGALQKYSTIYFLVFLRLGCCGAVHLAVVFNSRGFVCGWVAMSRRDAI